MLSIFQICVMIGWATCLFVCASVVYGPYTNKDSHIFSLNESVAYHALHRTGWGIAVSWIIFACATGHGGKNTGPYKLPCLGYN